MVSLVLKYGNNILQRSGNTMTGSPASPVVNFNASGLTDSQVTITKGTSINFYDTTTKNPTSWSWNLGTGNPSTSITQNPTGITYSTTGTTNISLTATNNWGSDSLTKISYINVISSGKKLAINLNAKSVDAIPYYTGITWTPSGMSTRTWIWNYLPSDLLGSPPTTGCTMSLKCTDNTSSNYTISIINPVFDSAYDNGKSTTTNTGIYPDDVLKYSLVNTSFSPVHVENLKLSGLNSLMNYKITLLGSRGAWTSTTTYVITGGTSKDGTTVSLSVNDNVMNTVSVSGVTPSSSGIIIVGVDNLDSGGYINAIEIDEE